jgi:signal transduction histidine kinase
VDAQDLAVLDEEISRLDNLLQTFLDFARPANLEAEDVDLTNLVRQTVDLLSSRAQSRNIRIETNLPDHPLIVPGDAAQLRQVLLNLMLNSLDAVPNGGEILVHAVQDHLSNGDSNDQCTESICLLVADNGRGLPADNRDRIYEPFFSTKETGLGLGLAISQRIVEIHRGQLAARDRTGGGTIFEIRLPLDRATTKQQKTIR